MADCDVHVAQQEGELLIILTVLTLNHHIPKPLTQLPHNSRVVLSRQQALTITNKEPHQPQQILLGLLYSKKDRLVVIAIR